MGSRKPALMFQGTGSNVGKSFLVAAFARALTTRGLKIWPFKPQNMSNNAAITKEGGEIGRAQAFQAFAAQVEPSAHMNPVLLKPETQTGAQLVVHGQVRQRVSAKEYGKVKSSLMPHVLESFEYAQSQSDMVLVEGAGSISEVNLRENDIANMGFAQAAQVPVVVIGDIDCGGVIASLVGSHMLLSPEDRKWVKGYLINKFRGDPSIFDPAVHTINQHTQWAHLGLVPFFSQAYYMPEEDSQNIKETKPYQQDKKVKLAILRFPCLANFDDFDPLLSEPEVQLVFIQPHQPIPLDVHGVILPGTKSTIEDLKVLKSVGWHHDLKALVRKGVHLLGICGGYQMLGQHVEDQKGYDGLSSKEEGLNFLNIETQMYEEKTLRSVQGHFLSHPQITIKGYEMHMGQTTGRDCQQPWLNINGQDHGASDESGRILGCYLHGLFHNDAWREFYLRRICSGSTFFSQSYEKTVDQALDVLAQQVCENVDMDRLIDMANQR